MFSLSTRARKKLTKKVNAKLPNDQPPAVGVIRGTTKGTWTTKVIVILVATGAILLASALMGYVAFPGGLWAIYMWRQFRPPRLIAVTPTAVLTFSQSMINNGPNELVASGPLVAYPVPRDGDSIHIGSDAIKLDDKEYAQLVQMIRQVTPAAMPAVTHTPAPVARPIHSSLGAESTLPTVPAPVQPIPASPQGQQY